MVYNTENSITVTMLPQTAFFRIFLHSVL